MDEYVEWRVDRSVEGSPDEEALGKEAALDGEQAAKSATYLPKMEIWHNASYNFRALMYQDPSLPG